MDHSWNVSVKIKKKKIKNDFSLNSFSVLLLQCCRFVFLSNEKHFIYSKKKKKKVKMKMMKKNLLNHNMYWLVHCWTCGHVLPFYSKLVTISALILWAFAWPPAPSMLWNMLVSFQSVFWAWHRYWLHSWQRRRSGSSVWKELPWEGSAWPSFNAKLKRRGNNKKKCYYI